MTKINFGGVEEEVITREEFPLVKAKEILEKEVMAVLGYGIQGSAQALNLRDNGFQVIVGQRQGSASWDKAVQDGWIAGTTLFSLEEAANKGTVLMYLLSDAGQKMCWPMMQPYLTSGKTLYLADGFSLVYQDQTKVIPPSDVDVVLISPKGSGLTLRRNFLKGSGLNSSFAVYQDTSGKALEKCLALGMAIGSLYLFPTTFQKEVYADLVGERGVLVGALTGLLEAQYNELRKRGHSPSEAFDETVEQLTQSLVPLIAENGMDGLYANISTTAQRGALDWKHKFRDAVAPLFSELYDRVANGTEAKIVLDKNSQPDYREKLMEELQQLSDEEMWKVGQEIRKLRGDSSQDNGKK